MSINSLLSASSIAVRALAYCAVGSRFETHFKLKVDTRPLPTQQQMGIWWKHWGDKGGEERNLPPYLTKPIAQDKCPFSQVLPNVRIVQGTCLYLHFVITIPRDFIAIAEIPVSNWICLLHCDELLPNFPMQAKCFSLFTLLQWRRWQLHPFNEFVWIQKCVWRNGSYDPRWLRCVLHDGKQQVIELDRNVFWAILFHFSQLG